MKPTTLLLSASLVANVALISVLATRSSDSAGISSTPSRSSAASSGNTSSSDALRAALASGDAAALKAAGLSADVARDLALGRALARYKDKIQAAGTDGRWWRNRSNARTREEELVGRRELSAALVAALGDDLGISGNDRGQLAFLSADKRAALSRITQDYDEMMAKYNSGGIQLASDKEKLRLLRAERDRDIAALLTPAELADYQLHTSASAATVRARYGDALDNEDDFKKLYALQKAFDDKFPVDALTGRLTPETMRARSEAQSQMQNDIRAALGDDRYAALRRATDPELRTLDSLVTRVGLPADTTDRVATTRETYAAESQRINADASLSGPERRAQLQALAARATTDLNRTLGAEVAEAYTPRASWVSILQGGMAFSTTPTASSPGGLTFGGGTQSVYPVMPAGTPGGGNQRQTVNFVSSTTDVVNTPSGGALFIGGGTPSGEPSANRTVQVISVNNSSTTTTTPAPADATSITISPAPKP